MFKKTFHKYSHAQWRIQGGGGLQGVYPPSQRWGFFCQFLKCYGCAFLGPYPPPLSWNPGYAPDALQPYDLREIGIHEILIPVSFLAIFKKILAETRDPV